MVIICFPKLLEANVFVVGLRCTFFSGKNNNKKAQLKSK